MQGINISAKMGVFVMLIQLEMFELPTEDRLVLEIDNVKKQNDKVRKALFARHGELAKKYVELHSRMEIIEKGICKNG